MKLISQLNKRERIFLYLTIALVIFGLVSKFVLGPLFSFNAKLTQELRAKQLHLRRIERLAQKKSLKDEYDAFIQALRMAESQELEMASILSGIEEFAKTTGVNIVSLRPQEIQERKVYKRFVIELKSEGTFRQIQEFAFLIESSPLILKIDKFQVTSGLSSAGLLSVDIAVSRIALP